VRILIAEDNVINQTIAVKMLEKMGFRADAVANGKEVITALNSIPYDLVLMDCQMPEMDGYEATAEIRKSAMVSVSKIPVVAMTANAMTDDAKKCLDAGMSDYVSKPISRQDLEKVILKWLTAV
jgi:CheY-like chemotaxis protein